MSRLDIGTFRIAAQSIQLVLLLILPDITGSILIVQSQSACPAGQYSANGLSPCTLCAAGRYEDATGSTICNLCNAGQYSTAAGATSYSACVGCPVNQWNNVTAATSCNSCPGNSGNDGNGYTYCFCNVGSFSATGRVTTSPCTLCAAGTYQASAAMSFCNNCAAGRYGLSQGLPGSTCTGLCPTNSDSIAGSVNCTCQPGTQTLSGSVRTTDQSCLSGGDSGGTGGTTNNSDTNANSDPGVNFSSTTGPASVSPNPNSTQCLTGSTFIQNVCRPSSAFRNYN